MNVRPYDPHRGIGRRPVQVIRPLRPLPALVLYLYELAWMIAVVSVFVWTVQ